MFSKRAIISQLKQIELEQEWRMEEKVLAALFRSITKHKKLCTQLKMFCLKFIASSTKYHRICE